MVLEDLHWSDPATSDLLVFLVRSLRRGRVVVVGTFRTDDLAGGDALLVRLAELTRLLECDPDRAQAARPRPAARDAGGILGRVPEQASSGASTPGRRGTPSSPRSWSRRAAPTATRQAPLPPSLRDILLGRLAGLSDEARRVLRIAAVAGQLTDDSLLADVTGSPPDELDAAIRETIHRQILDVDERSGTYRFRHALLAEAVARELLPGERRRLHEEVASWQSAAGPGGALTGRRASSPTTGSPRDACRKRLSPRSPPRRPRPRSTLMPTRLVRPSGRSISGTAFPMPRPRPA